MGKYTPLGVFLQSQTANSVIRSFADIEKIIGDALPPSARKSFTSWDNRHGHTGPVMQDSWLDVGWRTVMVDLENERVKFQRSLGV